MVWRSRAEASSQSVSRATVEEKAAETGGERTEEEKKEDLRKDSRNKTKVWRKYEGQVKSRRQKVKEKEWTLEDAAG